MQQVTIARSVSTSRFALITMHSPFTYFTESSLCELCDLLWQSVPENLPLQTNASRFTLQACLFVPFVSFCGDPSSRLPAFAVHPLPPSDAHVTQRHGLNPLCLSHFPIQPPPQVTRPTISRGQC